MRVEASSEGVLVAGRFIQGTEEYDRRCRPRHGRLNVPRAARPGPGHRCLRVRGLTSGAIGLLAGGILTQFLDWHWIFLVNPLAGLLTVALTVRVVPRDMGIGLSGGVDLLGGLLITAALMSASTRSSDPRPSSAGARRVR